MIRNPAHAKHAIAHMATKRASKAAAPVPPPEPVSTAATPAMRKREERERNTNAGMRRFEAWAHPDDFEDVRRYITRKLRRRGLVE
jgi:hypothetical protein